MKNYKLFITVVMGCAMLTGCGSTHVESAINSDAERDIVVEFTEDTELTPELIAKVESITSTNYKTHPYESCYRFKANEASYETIKATCEQLSELDYVKDAHTEYHK